MKLKATKDCPFCGTDISARASTCPRCGRSLSSAVYAFTPWWARLLATWIDMLIVLLPVAYVVQPLISPTFADSAAGGWLTIGALYGYFVVLEATTGTTVGKMVFKARVLRLNEQPIGWWRSLVRNFFKMLGLGLSLITLILILASRNSQRLGDMIAGTIVVRDVTERVRQGDPALTPEPPSQAPSAPVRTMTPPPLPGPTPSGQELASPTKAAAFCTSCGRPVDPHTDVFCRSCGRPVETS